MWVLHWMLLRSADFRFKTVFGRKIRQKLAQLRSNSMKCLVNWSPLNCTLVSNKTQPRFVSSTVNVILMLQTCSQRSIRALESKPKKERQLCSNAGRRFAASKSCVQYYRRMVFVSTTKKSMKYIVTPHRFLKNILSPLIDFDEGWQYILYIVGEHILYIVGGPGGTFHPRCGQK